MTKIENTASESDPVGNVPEKIPQEINASEGPEHENPAVAHDPYLVSDPFNVPFLSFFLLLVVRFFRTTQCGHPTLR